MDVGWAGAHELGEQVAPRGPLRDFVDVVDHQAHVERRKLAEGIEQAGQRIAAVTVPAEGDEDRVGQMVGVAVTRLTGNPRIDAARVDAVGPNGLAEQRGFSDSWFAEYANALSARHGQQTIDGTDAELERMFDEIAFER